MALPVTMIKQTGKPYFPMYPDKTVNFDQITLGINKAKSPKQLDQRELLEALNVYYNDDGRLVTRPGLSRYTSISLGAPIKNIARVSIAKPSEYGSAVYGVSSYGYSSAVQIALLSDSARRLYCVDAGGVPQRIGADINYSGVSDLSIIPFNSKAVILDGGYVKYWDGASLAMAYDDGDKGFICDHTKLVSQASRQLYAGSATIDGGVFTVPDFDAGFKIPLTAAKFKLSKQGNPTGEIKAKLYATSGGIPTGSVLAVSASLSVAELPSVETLTEFSFDLAATYQMTPGTILFAGIEYTGGDSSNCVKVARNNSGTAEYFYSGSSWSLGSGVPVMGVKPGLPPRADFGVTAVHRLFLRSASQPGHVPFSNVDSIFDWSTANGGGYIGVIDDGANTWPVGSLCAHFSDLFIFGTAGTPYVVRIQGLGDGPSGFSQQLMTQQVSAGPHTVVSALNEVWIANGSGTRAMVGSDAYGDVQVNDEGDAILPDMLRYFDPAATCQFVPHMGLFLLRMNNSPTVLVCHTKRPVQLESGRIVRPWTEWKFAGGITPSSFGYWGDDLYVGGADGYVYRLDQPVNDNGIQPEYAMGSGWLEFDFTGAAITRAYVMADSDNNWSGTLEFYRDGDIGTLVSVPVSDAIDPIRADINFTANSVRWRLSNITGLTSELKMAGLNMLINPQEI